MTKIEWTDRTWNPVAGCSVHSPGCRNCYAMKIAGARLKYFDLYKGLTDMTKRGPVFNGKLRAAPYDHKVWTWPLHTLRRFKAKHGRRPRVFVGDMSDLLHENRPIEDVDRAFAVMELATHIDF